MDKTPADLLREVAELISVAKKAIKDSDANIDKISDLVRAPEMKESAYREEFKQKSNDAVGRYNELHGTIKTLMEQMQDFVEQMKGLKPEELAGDSAKYVDEFNAEIARVQAEKQNQRQ